MSAFHDIKNTAKKITDPELAKKIQDSASNILQAGLGAVAKQQEESTKVFNALLKQGQEIESMTKGALKQQICVAEDRVEGVRKAAESKVAAVKDKANISLDKIETVVQEGVSQAIQQVNGITTEQVTKLNKRINELENALEKLETKLKK